MQNKKKLELLAPAGDLEKLKIADFMVRMPFISAARRMVCVPRQKISI